MGSICLSSASILRCDSLTRNQNIFLIIPTALEVIFSISLVFIDRGPGKRNLLLTAEGLIFLVLAVLELLAKILPAVRGNLRLFKALDLAIGFVSFMPISLYTIFLYLLTNAEIVSALPRRIKNITKLALLLFIPAIITFNEIASFIGVSIRNIPSGKAPETVIAIGFSGSTQQELWIFFTSLTLALLAGFQAAVFCFAFFRLTQAILDQRRIESQRTDKAHLIKGIAWISGSMKLGMVETVVGFAGGEFGVALTRRILRLLARAFLCIGVVKGVDLVEDFRAMRNELSVASGSKLRRLKIHEFISNPRLSTFHQLSPKATAFHTAQRASDIHEKSATYSTLAAAGLPGMAHFANVKAQNGHQRVTVRYDRGTPSLHVRFSMLDIPAALIEETKPRPQSERDARLSQPQPSFHRPLTSVFRDSADSVPSLAGPYELVATPRRMLSQRSARAQLYQAVSSPTSMESLYADPTTAVELQDAGRVQSIKSVADSLQAVRDLAGKFPGPPMAFKDQNTFIRPSVWEEVTIEDPSIPQALGSPSELLFKGPPLRKGNVVLSVDSTWSSNGPSPMVFSDNKSIRSSRQPTQYAVARTALKSAPLYSEKPIDPFSDDEENARSPSRPATADKKTSGATVPGFRQVNSLQDPEAGTEDVLDLATALDAGRIRQSRQSRSRKPRSSRQESLYKSDEEIARTAERAGSRSGATRRLPPTTKLPQPSHEMDTSIDHLPIPWLKNPDMEEEDRRVLRAMSKSNIPLSRVKTIGRAPRKPTPLPIQASQKRGSMHLKPIIIPPRSKNMPEIMEEYAHGSLESTAAGGGILRDSEVLEMGVDARRRNYF